MTKRRFSTGFFGTIALGLALFGLVPNEAKAIEVMCSNEYGHCEVADNPSWISCSCNNESSTGGTGGDEYQGLTEAELMAVCEAELAYCIPGEETDSATTTFGDTSTDSGNESMTSTSDTGTSDTEGTESATSTSDSGNDTSESGNDTSDSGNDTSDSGTSATSGDSGTTGDSGDATTTDSAGSESSSGGESSGDGTGLTGGGEDDADEASESEGDGPAANEGEGCSVVNDSGLGALALFGMFGLLGLRSRKRAA